MFKGQPYIGVIGAGECTPAEAAMAEEVGRELARRGAVIVCGGLGGVMEAAARGAQAAGGLVIGILPGWDPAEGNKYLTVALATGLGEARNAVITRTCDGLIAIAGGYGTLAEIGLALKMNKPVVGLGTWEARTSDGRAIPVLQVATPQDAVASIFRLLRLAPKLRY
ncbi:MAG: TIGR00725 family protein [Bacillota bacterium]